MKNRREFLLAAAATGVAAIFPASLRSWAARGTAMKGPQLVLPTATKDVTPFKVQVPQEALDDLFEQPKLFTEELRKAFRSRRA